MRRKESEFEQKYFYLYQMRKTFFLDLKKQPKPLFKNIIYKQEKEIGLSFFLLLLFVCVLCVSVSVVLVVGEVTK